MIVFSKFLSKKFLASITTIIIYIGHIGDGFLNTRKSKTSKISNKEENNNATDDIM